MSILPRGYQLTNELKKRTSNRVTNKHQQHWGRPKSQPLDMQQARRKSRVKVTLPKVTLL